MSSSGDASPEDPKEVGRAASAGQGGAQDEALDEAAVDPRLDRLIGQSLEAHYADILAAPLPDKFLVLLAQLEASEQKK